MATSGEEKPVRYNYYYLPHEYDKFGGVIVGDLSHYSTDVIFSFTWALDRSLRLWRTKGKKVVWLKIPIERNQFVHPAFQAGFKYHHVAPDREVLDATKNVVKESGYAMLVKWFPGPENTFRASASHCISAVAFVLNNQKQMLAVMEKSGKHKGAWTMPTGVINQGEHIFEGIKRAVKEKTNIKAEFVQVIGFNEIHSPMASIDDKSNMSFLCGLHALSSTIIVQNSELTDAKWMSVEEFGAQEYLKKPEEVLLVKMLEASIEAAKKAPGAYKGFRLDNVHAGIIPRPMYFYNNSGCGVVGTYPFPNFKFAAQHLQTAMAEFSNLAIGEDGDRIPQPPPTEDSIRICTFSLWVDFSEDIPVLSIRPHTIPTIPETIQSREVVATEMLMTLRRGDEAAVRARARAGVNPLGLIIPKRRRSLWRW